LTTRYKKKVIFVKYLIEDEELTRKSKKSSEKIEEEYEENSRKKFQHKFDGMFVCEKGLWFKEKIARFAEALKLVLDAEWSR